jgi:uncharacterized protein (TIGR00251 family)
MLQALPTCAPMYAGRRRGGEGAVMKARIQVKIKTRAKRSEIAGRIGDSLKINVAAPPLEGRANLEVIRLIAELADVPRSHVRIVMGESNPRKLIEIDGIGQDEFLRRMG